MNFNNILNDIAKADPEVYDKVDGRRGVLKSFGSKVALAALPLALGSMFKKAYGKTTSGTTVIDVLNFALELEYFEFNFYHTANATGGLIAPADQAGFRMVEDHERAHVNFLTSTISAMGGTPYTPPNYNPGTGNIYVPTAYDFTAGNTYHVFEDYATFLTVAQAFEDTGVRAYQGQVPNLTGAPAVLTQAMQICTVEARHASFIRLVRRMMGAAEQPKPWITNNIAPHTGFIPNYAGEDNVTQLNVDITTLPDITGTGTLRKDEATAAFDEPLSKETVASLIAPFFA